MMGHGWKSSLLFVGFILLVVLSVWATGSAKPVPPGQAAAVGQSVVQEKDRGPDYLRASGALPTSSC